MPALLYGIGAFALFAGLAMVGFGIPINEFSFGNTLISAGTTAAVGGLVIIGLGVVAGQMRRVVDALAVHSLSVQVPEGRGRPVEPLENTVTARPLPPEGRTPISPRPRSEVHSSDPAPVQTPATMPFEDELPDSFPPGLHNPEDPLAVEDEISLSPPAQVGGNATFRRPTPPPAPSGIGSNMAEKNREPMAGWRPPPHSAPSTPNPPTRQLHSANFDAMWPAEAKPPRSPAASEVQQEARLDTSARDAFASSKRAEPDVQKLRTAVLKSGVVDGMGYTLYVDGSIEAELPQGTLRFASINELRSHLAKNS
jgi:hypothetical protein